MDMATLNMFLLRGTAEAVQGPNSTLRIPEEIRPPGYCSVKQRLNRCNGIQQLPGLTLEVGKPLQGQGIHDSCSQGMKVSDEPSSFTGKCLSNRFEADGVHRDLSKETRKDYVLHDTELFEDSSPSCIGAEDKHSAWERLSIEEALGQMSEMHCADNYVEKCVFLLQKCKRRGSLAIAARMYAHICNNGLEAHGILGSYIVAMFVHSSNLLMAQQAYNRLFHHNEYSWTHLLQGYIEWGDPEHGLYLFSRMKKAGIRPNKFTFVAVLRACTRLKCINRGQQLHTEIVKVLEEELYITRALVDFYVKCGLFAEACDIFNDLHSSASYTTVYLDHALHKYSSDSSDDMQLKEVPSNAVAYVFSLKACSSMKALATGRELHLQVVKEGHDLDCFVSNTLIDLYAKCGLLSEAWKVLDRMLVRDVVSWTALITGCVEHGLCEYALKYSEIMQKEGVPANAFTLVACLKACGLMGSLDSGRKLHAEIMKEGLYMDFVICNSLVDMYAKCRSLEEARWVFDKLSRQDIISWTSLISGYTDHGSFKEAISCFEQMQLAGTSPNTVTFICCIKACAFLADLDMGRRLHNDLVKEELETHVFVGNTLLRMYARCGSYLEAQAVFEDLPYRDVVSWTVLIAELAQDGHGEQALKFLEQMHNEDSSPSSFTYVCSLKACASIGALEKGRKLHIEIIKRGLERIPFVSKALIGMYAECGKPINLDIS